MGELWFWLLAFMLAVYAVLDGFDLGVGILHLWLARTPAQRATLLRSIGPVWDGNEVWLVAAGGTLFAAFPVLYATAFSGFYLPLMLVLWLLVLRALGIELRHQIDNELWHQAWDVAFAVSSGLLALVFGAALGNLVRGLPLDEKGQFFEPLWTDFRVGETTGILDWYTVLVGVSAVLVLTLHGALWIALKTTGELAQRARNAARRAWPAVVVTCLLTTLGSSVVQPQLVENAQRWPLALLLPLAGFASLVLVRFYLGRAPGRAFLASGVFIAGLLASAAFAIFPQVLPARIPGRELTIAAAAAAPDTAARMLWWWVPGVAIAALYSVLIYTRLPRTFGQADSDH